MKLKNCPECGKIFVDNPGGLCPDCLRQEEEDELKVTEYLREVRKASLIEIHNATGVKEKTIMRMLKKGRIYSDFKISYPCETCGRMIDEGRLCADCSRNIIDQLPANDWKPNEPKVSSRSHERMYFGTDKKR